MAPAVRQIANPEVRRLRENLTLLEVRVESVDRADEIAGDMARYFCVRISGYLEQAVTAYGRSAVEQHSFSIGSGFGLSYLKRSFNANADALQQYVGRFSSKWSREFADFMAEQERSNRVNSLLGIRNDIAHGKNQGVSPTQAKSYLELVDEIVHWIQQRFEPMPGVSQASDPSS